MSDVKYYGKYRAKVVDVNDPERRGRIRVQCPSVLGTHKSAWCEPCIPYATDFAGDYYVPPVNEAIWVEFEEGDVNKPIWNGGWYKIGSTPLLSSDSPESKRFISFKNTIIHLCDKEIIFEFRNGDNTSSVLKLNPQTLVGLAYIAALGENGGIDDLSSLVSNSYVIQVTTPNDLQSNINSVNNDLNSFKNQVIQVVVPNLEKSISDLNNKVSSLEKSVNDFNTKITGLEYDIKNLQERVTELELKR